MSSLRTEFVLDALDQAIYERCGNDVGDLIHHSGRSSQYLAMRYTERLHDFLRTPQIQRTVRRPNQYTSNSHQQLSEDPGTVQHVAKGLVVKPGGLRSCPQTLGF